MAALKFACVVAVMSMVLVTAPLARAITCGQVVRTLSPCLSYVQSSSAGVPPAQCCRGVSTLNREARTTGDRRITCNCLKSFVASSSRFNFDTAASLPRRCRVRIPYRISPSTNCNGLHNITGSDNG
uniref:Non-specific lipid-transfer protein n=1 Tax=Phaseolus vulgaris TaxID=3885 RepID=V7AMU2_PHAVU|nr:hypothetical protein PHAVU_010G079000g [Phaseolus vulgaris]ESW06814.1 hypothetical protein PHAVU_010G079000g [Phaseolus vulgaris]